MDSPSFYFELRSIRFVEPSSLLTEVVFRTDAAGEWQTIRTYPTPNPGERHIRDDAAANVVSNLYGRTFKRWQEQQP